MALGSCLPLLILPVLCPQLPPGPRRYSLHSPGQWCHHPRASLCHRPADGAGRGSWHTPSQAEHPQLQVRNCLPRAFHQCTWVERGGQEGHFCSPCTSSEGCGSQRCPTLQMAHQLVRIWRGEPASPFSLSLLLSLFSLAFPLTHS